MSTRRRYGYFSCPKCKRGWESAHAWCYEDTDEPSSGQQCQNPGCPNDYIKPYKVERLKCPKCGSNDGCLCDHDDDDQRHNDPEKPHRSDLCERCNKGLTCKFR